MAIGICLKIDTSGLQQKCFSGDFLQLLELHLIVTHIGGCFQRVRLQNIGKVFRKKPVWWSPFQVKMPENLKISYFPKRALRVSLPFGLRVTIILPQEYRKVWISVGKKFLPIRWVLLHSSCYGKSMGKTMHFSYDGICWFFPV